MQSAERRNKLVLLRPVRKSSWEGTSEPRVRETVPESELLGNGLRRAPKLSRATPRGVIPSGKALEVLGREGKGKMPGRALKSTLWTALQRPGQAARVTEGSMAPVLLAATWVPAR